MRFQRRLIVAANRLPITVRIVDGHVRLCSSDGGLVCALKSILRDTRGCWIGWPGSDYDKRSSEAIEEWAESEMYSLKPVFLNDAERNGFYRGFSNEIIWPLFHGFSTRCSFNIDYWNHYRDVNARFAAHIEQNAEPADFIWVHDYQLMLVAAILRARGEYRDLAYFHHIPFPPPDIFEILPWRDQILRALVQFNVLGFQTARDQRNFVACVRRGLPNVSIRLYGNKYVIGHTTTGVYPISIDQESFAREALTPAVDKQTESIKRSMSGVQLILGVDRLDYTKGIIERLAAYRALLQRHSEFRGRVSLIQIAVPSREEILEYRQLRLQIENVVSNINGEYGTPGWTPVQYFYRSVPRTELVAYYRAADVAAVTPLKDGMNLVAKEFCASRHDIRGVLILSEFAGAAEELRDGALMINPHDIEGFVAALRRALLLSESEQSIRMVAMRSQIRDSDVFRWAHSFTTDCLNSTNAPKTGIQTPLKSVPNALSLP